MFARLSRELKRLFFTRRTWLLIGVMVLSPILMATDFLGLGGRTFNTAISNVLMLNPARLSLYISAFSMMAFTLLELKELYAERRYTFVESTVNPLSQALVQTVAVCLIVLASSLAAMAVLYPYTAFTMQGVFSLMKFIRVWGYIYALEIVLTVLLTSGTFLIFRNLEVSLVLMSALMLFSIARPVESYYLTHWLQTSVTSLTDGTESMLKFRVIQATRYVWMLLGAAYYALGLLCMRRYGEGIKGSLWKNLRKAVIPLILAASVAASSFFITHDPLFWKDPNDTTLLTEWIVDEETQTVIDNYSLESEFEERMHDHNEQYNLAVMWTEMRTDVTVEKDHLDGKLTFEIRRSRGDVEPEAEEVTLRFGRGMEPTEIFCGGESLTFARRDFNFMSYYYYYFSIPAEVDQATLEVFFSGYPRGSTDTTELYGSITEQYVQLFEDVFPQLMIKAADVRTFAITLSESLTVTVTELHAREAAPAKEGYRTYVFEQRRGEAFYGFNIFAGEYEVETAQVGGLEIQFLYFKNKSALIKEMRAIEFLRDAVSYYTELFGPLAFNGRPLIIAEVESEGKVSGWQTGNFCCLSESALVSSLYRADKDAPEASRGEALRALVEAVARQWWDVQGYGTLVYDGALRNALFNYGTYLYVKRLYGEDYAKKALAEPWYQQALYEKNEFYQCNKDYISILPLQDAVEIYHPFKEKYKLSGTAAFFHLEELAGGEEVFTQKLAGIYDRFKGGREVSLTAFDFLYPELLISELGITQEEYESW